MKKLYYFLFPLAYAKTIKLTEKQIEDNNKLYNDLDLFITGEERLAWEYEQKTGRDLLSDTLKSSLVLSFILTIIILITVYIVSK